MQHCADTMATMMRLASLEVCMFFVTRSRMATATEHEVINEDFFVDIAGDFGATLSGARQRRCVGWILGWPMATVPFHERNDSSAARLKLLIVDIEIF